MCNIDSAISIIQNYIYENLFEPALSWNELEFKKRSYQRWAAYEICNRLMDRPLDNPIRVIDSFIFEISAYGEAENPKSNFIFQSVAEVAKELILLFV